MVYKPTGRPRGRPPKLRGQVQPGDFPTTAEFTYEDPTTITGTRLIDPVEDPSSPEYVTPAPGRRVPSENVAEVVAYRDRVKMLAEKIRPEARRLYQDARDHFICARERPSNALLCEVWGIPQPTLWQWQERDRKARRDWETARAHYWSRLAQATHVALIEQQVADETKKRQTYLTYSAQCFAIAQQSIDKIGPIFAEKLSSNLSRGGRDMISTLWQLTKLGRECFEFEELVAGNSVAREMERRNLADLKRLRDIVLRYVTEPDQIDGLRREIDKLLMEREAEHVDGMMLGDGSNEMEKVLESLSKIHTQLEEVSAVVDRTVGKPEQPVEPVTVVDVDSETIGADDDDWRPSKI